MKKLFLIILFFIFLKSFGQTFPITQNIGAKTTIVNTAGAFRTTTGFIYQNFSDTSEANIPDYLRFTPSAVILTGYQDLWVRNSTANAWIKISGGGSGSTITSLGGGFPVGITGTNDTRTINGANGLFPDSTTTSNVVTFNLGATSLALAANKPFTSDRFIQAGSTNVYALSMVRDISVFGPPYTSFPYTYTEFTRPTVINLKGVDGGTLNFTVFDSTCVVGSSFPGLGWYAGYNQTLQAVGPILHWTATDKHYDIVDVRSATGSLTYADIQFNGFSTIDWRPTGETYLGLIGTHRVGINRGLGALGAMFDVNGTSKFADSMFLFSRILANTDSIYGKRSDGSLGAIAPSAIISGSGQRFGVATEDTRATTSRTFSAANNAFKLDSLGDGTRFVTYPKTLGGRKMSLVSTNATDSGYISISGDLSTQLRTLTLATNSTSINNSNDIVLRGGSAISDIYLTVRSTGTSNESIVGMDSSLIAVYRRHGTGRFSAATYYLDDSLFMWSGVNRESQLTLAANGSADQWALNRLAWRTTDSTAKIVLTKGFAYIDSRDSILFDNDAGYYRYTNMASTIDTTTYKFVVMDINGKIKRANSIAQFSSGGGSGVTSVSAGFGMNFTTITTTGNVIADSTVLLDKLVGTNITGAMQFLASQTFTPGTTTGTTTSSGIVENFNSLTAGTGHYISSSSLTSGSLLNIVSTSTALAAGNTGINVAISGANGTNAITATGISSTVTNTNATSGTNIGIYGSASGATTANISIKANERIHIGAPTYNANTALNIQSITNTATDDVIRVYANNLSTFLAIRYGMISQAGVLTVEGLGGFKIQGLSSGVKLNMTSGGLFFMGGSTTPTATVHIAAQTTAASTAPIKLTTGSLQTTAEAGAFEYSTPSLYFTNGGAQRQEIPQIQQSRVTTQFDKTSSTALANITGLTATLVAGKIYRFEANLFTTSNSGGGVQFAIAGTATATTIIYEGLTTDAGLTTQGRGTALATAVGAVTAVTAAYCRITGYIVVNAAGTLTVQFAQNASNGTASSVLVGSNFVTTEMN